MRVILVPVGSESLDAELASDLPRLAACLGADVDEWPPIGGEWDRDAMQHFRSIVDSPSFDARLGPFYVLVDGALVASAGFLGPLDDASEGEIGYSVCQCHRRKGIATATIAELCHSAAALDCRSLRARVRADNIASIKALQHNGFSESERGCPDGQIVLRRFLR